MKRGPLPAGGRILLTGATGQVGAELLVSPIYANLRKAHARLIEVAGPPPFTLQLGKKAAAAHGVSAPTARKWLGRYQRSAPGSS